MRAPYWPDLGMVLPFAAVENSAPPGSVNVATGCTRDTTPTEELNDSGVAGLRGASTTDGSITGRLPLLETLPPPASVTETLKVAPFNSSGYVWKPVTSKPPPA